MSDQSPAADPPAASPPLAAADGAAATAAAALIVRDDGVYLDLLCEPGRCLAAVDAVFASGARFANLDYAVLTKLLYGIGPELGAAVVARLRARLADAIVPFAPARRALYKSVKIDGHEAEYYFEAVFLDEAGEEGAGVAAQRGPARLDFDEFVADLWHKGVRFGIDATLVRAAIASPRSDRLVVAAGLAPIAGRDAALVDVALEVQRSDAPRQRADGRFDLLSFKNRFPQVRKNVRMLKKLPGAPGRAGRELSGAPIEAPPFKDFDLEQMAGPGTLIERQRDGQYLVSAQDGFLDVDSASNRISVGSTIVSRDGVSSRTTGNLQLTRAYEEFGDVQEQRSVEGADITIHGDVFGHIRSRGGDIVLHRNLVGGSATSADGDIEVKGIASGALLQTLAGKVVMARAEGCAIAGRRIAIDSAGPRKQNEMLLFPLVPDMAGFDQRIAALEVRASEFALAALKLKQEIEELTSRPEVRNYLTLAVKVRKHEVVLNPEQLVQFQKMALAVGPALKAVGKLSLDAKALDAQRQEMLAQAREVDGQKSSAALRTHCTVRHLSGEILVRSMTFNPDAGRAYDKSVKQIKACLHAPEPGAPPIFHGSEGTLDWTCQPDL